MEDADTTPWENQLTAALRGEPEVWTDDCLPPETMIALADRSLPKKKATVLLAHVSLCARCRREYTETCELVQLSQEVHALEAAAAPPSWKRWQESLFGKGWRSPALGMAVGACACAALYLGMLVPARKESDRLAAAVKERDTRLAAVQKEKIALGDELAHLKRGQLDTAKLAAEVKGLTAKVQAQSVQVARLEATENALAQVSLPPAEWALAHDGGTVRGGGGGPKAELTLKDPVETALTETRPTLECRPVSGASDYQAHLEIDGAEGDTPPLRPLSPIRWEVSAPLRPGTVYRWYVTAQRGGKTVSAAPARFYVLSDSQRRELTVARKTLSKQPLALGVVYARLGLTADAEGQLRAALKADPNARVAKRWLDQLQKKK